jgi:hypothetical protein
MGHRTLRTMAGEIRDVTPVFLLTYFGSPKVFWALMYAKSADTVPISTRTGWCLSRPTVQTWFVQLACLPLWTYNDISQMAIKVARVAEGDFNRRNAIHSVGDDVLHNFHQMLTSDSTVIYHAWVGVVQIRQKESECVSWLDDGCKSGRRHGSGHGSAMV